MGFTAKTSFTGPSTNTSYTTGQAVAPADAAALGITPALFNTDINISGDGQEAFPLTNGSIVTAAPVGTALTTAGTSVYTSQPFAPPDAIGAVLIDVSAVAATPSLAVVLQVADQNGNWENALSPAALTPTAATDYEIPFGPETSNNTMIPGTSMRIKVTCSGAGAGATFGAFVISGKP